MGYGRRKVADLHVVFKTSCQRQLLNKLKHRRRICKLEAVLAHERKGQQAAVVTVEAETSASFIFHHLHPVHPSRKWVVCHGKVTRPNRNRQSHPSYRHSIFTMRSNAGSCVPSMPSTMSSRTAMPSLGKLCRRFSRGRMLSVLALASLCLLLIGGIFECYLGGSRQKRRDSDCATSFNWMYLVFLTPAFFPPCRNSFSLYLFLNLFWLPVFGPKALLQMLWCGWSAVFSTHLNDSSTCLPYFCPCLV